MDIVTFSPNHIQQAIRIITDNYEEERKQVPVLPEIPEIPDLGEFADNGLGVAAFEKNEMLGFLCCHEPFDFGKIKNSFSPVHGHGAISKNRNRIYAYLYQSAADVWVSKGVFRHAIALYAHDTEAVSSFFWNGFGLRCIDAIRPVEKIKSEPAEDFEFGDLPQDEIVKILPLKNGLASHLNESPVFMRVPPFDGVKIVEITRRRQSRCFYAKKNNRIIAYIEIMARGENFATYGKKMMNICGAFMVPEYCGSGIYTQLLNYLLQQLETENFIRLGVDYESINPTAKGFWLKYFTPYTYSVVRVV